MAGKKKGAKTLDGMLREADSTFEDAMKPIFGDSISGNRKGPKTFKGQINKMLTGDGRKNPVNQFSPVDPTEFLLGTSPSKKKKGRK